MDTSSGAPQAYPSTPGLYHLTTQADGHTVSYTLRIPAGYDGHTALPVILCLHFGGQPTEFYGGRFLNLIPIPGFGSLDALRDLPLYVIHSEADRRVPIEDDAKAVERLHAMGAPVEFARLPSGDHFDYRLVIAELRNKVCPWLEAVWQHP